MKIYVLLGSTFRRIINLVSTEIRYIVLYLSFRKVSDQTFSKEAKKMIPQESAEKNTDDQTNVSRILINIEKTDHIV